MKRGLVIAMVMLAALLLGFLLGSSSVEKRVIYKYVEGCETGEAIYSDIKDEGSASIEIPAVNEDGEGIITTLAVQIKRGSGRILTNIDKLLFWTDTQNSIRIARMVVENITGKSLARYDLIYTIETNASVVEGSSAGAAIVIATIAALEGKRINKSVMITGSINHDGTLGPVGNVMEKAIAAKNAGAKLLLVPLMHAQSMKFERKKYCEKIGTKTLCWTETVPKKIDIEDKVKIRMKEIINIKDALKYFFTE